MLVAATRACTARASLPRTPRARTVHAPPGRIMRSQGGAGSARLVLLACSRRCQGNVSASSAPWVATRTRARRSPASPASLVASRIRSRRPRAPPAHQDSITTRKARTQQCRARAGAFSRPRPARLRATSSRHPRQVARTQLPRAAAIRCSGMPAAIGAGGKPASPGGARSRPRASDACERSEKRDERCVVNFTSRSHRGCAVGCASGLPDASASAHHRRRIAPSSRARAGSEPTRTGGSSTASPAFRTHGRR